MTSKKSALNTFQASSLAIVQLDDSRRAVACACAALRAISLDAPATELGSECARLYEALIASGNAIADLKDRCRVRGAA